MTQENVEIVERFLDAFNGRDRGAVSSLLHPEIEWHTMAGPVFGVEAMKGREQALRFMFEGIEDAIADFRVIGAEVSELPGDQVLSVARSRVAGPPAEPPSRCTRRLSTASMRA
jgi:ketosteroid isomerase-like protein